MGSKPGRQLASWKKDEIVKVAKMVAWLVFHHMGGRSEQTLIPKFEQWLPLITERVLQQRITLEDLRTHFKETQGREITDNAIYHRGDKAVREGEYNLYQKVVLDVWRELAHGVPAPSSRIFVPTTFPLDPRRTFSDEVVAAKIIEQGGECGYCTRPFSELVRPVGDHCLPHSKGGRTDPGNCVAACVSCNEEKSDSLPHVFQRRLDLRLSARGRQKL